jgi:hypothetical protein
MRPHRGILFRPRAAVTLALLLLPSAVSVGADAGRESSGRFRPAAIVEHVRFLASDSLEGRRSGTPGGRIASEYVRDRFEAAGLEPAAGDGGFFQEYSFVSEVVPGAENALRISCGGKTFDAAVGVDFLPLGATANDMAEGPVVFVGYGLKDPQTGRDDYAGLDLDGAVALALAGAPSPPGGPDEAGDGPGDDVRLRRKAMLAREAGAAALLIAGTVDGGDLPDRIEYDGTPVDVGIPFARVSRAIAGRILACGGLTPESAESTPSRALGDATARVRTDVVRTRSTGRNVLARIPGRDPALRDRFVVVGAHYDHLGSRTSPDGGVRIFNGADDNASGVAGLLELAAALHAAPPRRSLLFAAFDGEELGALGSLQFMKAPTVPKDRIDAMINLDMIGRMQDRKLVVSGADTSPAWDELLERAGTGLDLEVRRSAGGFGGSDQTSFYKDGIPVLFFFTGAHDDYHQPTDDWDRIDAEGEALILEYAARCIEGIGNADEPPPFHRSEAGPRHTGGRSSLSVYLGTVPDFTYEGEGFAIIGTKAGSPADRAGLLKGDVIVRMDGRDVRNIYDFMGVLGDHSPGDVIDVVVAREGAERTLSVTLGKK